MEEYARSFPTKLSSNYVPSDSEITKIRELLREQVTEITEVDEYISSACDGMLQEQERIKGHIKGLQALLSPTRRLSRQILQRIYFFCLPTKRNAVMSSEEAPLLLGRVSRTWRDISLNTPQLWSTIHIPILYRQQPPLSEVECDALSNHRNEAVKRWLDRSGTCPLSISVVEVRFGAGPDLPNDPGESLFEVVAQFSKRWSTIELNCTSTLRSFMFRITDKDVPMLKSISIKAPSGKSSACITGAGALLFFTPRLQTLRLMNMSGSIFNYAVNWLNITELYIEGHGNPVDNYMYPITAAVALLLLSRCLSLVQCRLNIRDVDQSDPLGVPVILPFLTELWITESLGSPAHFYKSLEARALQKFRYSNSRVVKQQDFPPAELLFRCHYLETLILNPTPLTCRHIIYCLLNTPSITTLVLEAEDDNQVIFTYGPNNTLVNKEPAVNDTLIELLTRTVSTVDGEDEYLCPQLQHFQCKRNAISDEFLLRFIKSRTSGPNNEELARLKRVDISLFFRTWTIDIIQHLSSEIANGLRVSLEYSKVTPVAPSAGMKWNDESD